ncbi:hypothetical protein, partial [Hydrotalea sp.]|uniref:hypothetical protein n=1 Tax=Hydrotalea sp. TaxID=2881279 RepID=UPI00261D5FB8
MKRFLLTLCLLAGFVAVSYAQPQSFKYQAVARGLNGALLSNQQINVRLSILLGTSPNRTLEYQETQTVTTNQYGLFYLDIGKGTPTTSAKFTDIDWASPLQQYIQTEIDLGQGYVNMGASEMLSVPYALYALNSPKGPTGATGSTGATGTAGANVLTGTGIPASSFGFNGDSYVDISTGNVYTKNAGAWVSSGATLKGNTGATGPTGLTGNAALSGTGAPGNGSGNNGDTYIDNSTGIIYTKTGGVWTSTGNSLMGATGATGAAGFSVLSGSGIQSNGLGNNGDTYIDNNTGIMYVKSGGIWVSSGKSLMGATGVTGSTGAIGTTGPQGLQGIQGITGVTGPTGNDGASALSGNGTPANSLGNNGDTYINITTGNIYQKSGGVWVNSGLSFKGITGATGTNGATGQTGATGNTGQTGTTGQTGAAGATGSSGATGQSGATGPQGATGAQGLQGIQGITGVTGPTGNNGASILSGNGTPANSLGNNGDIYIDISTGNIYQKSGGVWVNIGLSFKGITGATGVTGATGTNGVTGVTGAT